MTIMEDRAIDIILAGVGGQGVVTASEVLAQALKRSGLSVKKGEIHGMAQRGGSVSSDVRAGVVRAGEGVFSPVIPDGAAGFLAGFEKLEALRHAHRLKAGGTVILNSLEVRPLVSRKNSPPYPDDIEGTLASMGLKVISVAGSEMAGDAGEPRAAGMVLLGVLSMLLPATQDMWVGAVKSGVRAGALDVSLDAFERGRAWFNGRF